MSQVIDIEELKRIYTQPSWGYSDAELGARLGVDRSAIFKARRKLSDSGIEFVQTDRGRYRIDREKFVSNIPANAPESTMLYVGLRRLSRNTRLARKHLQNALEKLAIALYQPMAERLVKAADNLPTRADAQQREQIFEVLVRAWTEQSKVRIWYRGLKSDATLTHGVSPYLIEPSPWSDSVYLIGYTDVMEKIVPFKIERIEKAILTSEPPKLQQLDDTILFRYAWGIWHTDQEPELVRLRFTGREAIRRVGESIWHPEETVDEQDDGSVIWEAQIAEWQEMVPWIRGWGAACEVLAPARLRETLMGEAKAVAEMYGWYVSSTKNHDENTTLTDFFGG